MRGGRSAPTSWPAPRRLSAHGGRTGLEAAGRGRSALVPKGTERSRIDAQVVLESFSARQSVGHAFHPAMMTKVLVYAYATGVFSSRKIARKLHEDVAFRVLAAANFPAHRTISDFRAFHLKELTPSHPTGGSRTCWGS